MLNVKCKRGRTLHFITPQIYILHSLFCILHLFGAINRYQNWFILYFHFSAFSYNFNIDFVSLTGKLNRDIDYNLFFENT